MVPAPPCWQVACASQSAGTATPLPLPPPRCYPPCAVPAGTVAGRAASGVNAVHPKAARPSAPLRLAVITVPKLDAGALTRCFCGYSMSYFLPRTTSWSSAGIIRSVRPWTTQVSIQAHAWPQTAPLRPCDQRRTRIRPKHPPRRLRTQRGTRPTAAAPGGLRRTRPRHLIEAPRR